MTLSFLFFASCLLAQANCRINAIVETYLVLENAEEHGIPPVEDEMVVSRPIYSAVDENIAKPNDPSTTIETGTAPSFPKPPTVLAACQRFVATIIRESCEVISEENLNKVLEKCCREPCSLMEIVQGCRRS
ncbi:hypothetical protein B9Z55_022438 [Caenorhabditis nigoni]|nr:hypothetical protein B9Z55_022438 [Caenorhabditis nigoni]